MSLWKLTVKFEFCKLAGLLESAVELLESVVGVVVGMLPLLSAEAFACDCMNGPTEMLDFTFFGEGSAS